jgi:hypothetical protein
VTVTISTGWLITLSALAGALIGWALLFAVLGLAAMRTRRKVAK